MYGGALTYSMSVPKQETCRYLQRGLAAKFNWDPLRARRANQETGSDTPCRVFWLRSMPDFRIEDRHRQEASPIDQMLPALGRGGRA